MKHIFIALIKVYRLTLSPIIGQQCRFYPTCSHYGEEAINRYGAWKGGWMALKRIGRCGPWCEGGYDPVPEIDTKNQLEKSVENHEK